MHKLTRISYNSKNWQKPTGEARQHEGPRTYNHQYGFGHEDWLFRFEWLVSGWRYAFLQGVNKGRRKLLKARQPFDLTLFTVEPKAGRRFVATIYDVECLDNQQSQDALEAFKQCGWLATMGKEIRDVNGDDSVLGNPKWANDILNIRFRLENTKLFPPSAYAESDNPVRRLNRYQLYDYDPTHVYQTSELKLPARRAGSSSLPAVRSFKRKGTAGVECTPEHARMQQKLMEELRVEYPNASIEREEDFVDVRVRTQHESILFEIKSDLEPRTVIRQALGQILEYAFHPNNRRETLPVRLVIVGRGRLPYAGRDYLDRLKQEFYLPIEYRVVNLT